MDGALLIDKPAGLTSHDVVARVRRTLGEPRAGHTGTLDPFATGVLVILLGRATRLAQFLSSAEKEYEAVIRLGYATDTGDATGQRLSDDIPAEARQPPALHQDEIEAALKTLRGEIEQTPPMYSAKKVGGQRLYELARRGQQVQRQPIRITVSELEAIPINGPVFKTNDDNQATADLRVRVVCSAGTYIRTLAEDLGKQLGVGAHLVELRRTRAGVFRIQDAIGIEQLAELSKSKFVESRVISPDALVSHLPAVQLTAEQVMRAIHGIDLSLDQGAGVSWESGQAIRMRNADNQLIAVGFFDESRGLIHPKVVIAGR